MTLGSPEKLPPIGWYVHVPFCTTKCGYCDFYSLPSIAGMEQPLVDALLREIDVRTPGRRVECIFVGGGTPTVMPATQLGALLGGIAFRARTTGEFTVEANPSTTDELKLDLLLAHGVNRISFGAQSFNEHELHVLERLHDPRAIVESVRAARAAGFDNLNLDLIYAIPGQTIDAWRENLRRAIDLGTDHLSCYSLMYEKGTSLTRLRHEGKVVACDEDVEADMFDLTIDELTAAGFEHYEISNFAKPGRRCCSNIIYWENREYLGVGPSAVSYLDGVRRKNIADVRRYVQSADQDFAGVVTEEERLDPLRRAGETAIQMLRLTDGLQFDRFAELTGVSAGSLFDAQMGRFTELGLAVWTANSFRLTRAGLRVANRIMEEFLPSPSEPCGFALPLA